jgi:UDP-N-acetylmuramoyl-tripeptide--D-alanyl-D-alanine ligase
VSRQLLVQKGRLYRQTVLRRVTFIGVTGSCGKTTTKELIAAVLSTKLKGHKSLDSYNASHHLAQAMLEIGPRHDFCVLEMAVGRRLGQLPVEVALVKPQIGVVTTVNLDHISVFRTADAITAEKSELVARLPPDGTAVLNADDPRVLAMQARARCRVLTYGLAPLATVRAGDITGRWPDPLAFTVVHAGESHRVETQLYGAHLLPNVLAALTVAIAMKIPLAASVEAVRTVTAYPGRMSPVSSPDGVTFIRDDYKAPLYSIPAVLQFLQEARATRKVVVMGTISDFLGPNGPKYVGVAEQALEVADHVILVGPNASMSLKAKRHRKGAALYAAETVDDARQFLGRILQPGDLVLLKGSSKSDHLETLVTTRVTSGGQQAPRAPEAALGTRDVRPIQVVIGLGNPGDSAMSTPHNVGQRTVDLVAVALGARFEAAEEALVARVEQPAATWYLVKPVIRMNATGSVVISLGARLGFGAEDIILVQDDIDLPVGTVRTRMDGGDGGHRGVRSVLFALQSDAVRRVKIGVGRPAQRGDVLRHVLETFEPAEAAVVDKACAEAAKRVLDLLGIRVRSRDVGSAAH